MPPRRAQIAFLPLLAVLAIAPARPAALDDRLAEWLDRPAAARAFWGILAVDLADDRVVYERNADRLFTPASNAKLYSTALALARLGPDYRFETILGADARIDESGALLGDLRLIGGGDPNLSSRVIPYDPKNDFRPDRMEPMREFARQVVEAGVSRVEGDIVGDAARYVWDPYPAGWTIDDAVWSYGSPVSALSFNDSLIQVRVRPGVPGAPARLSVSPDAPYLAIRNHTRTAASRTVSQRLSARRGDAPSTLELWGGISSRSPGRDLDLAVDDPALFAAAALRRALEEAGVLTMGETRAHKSQPWEFDDLRAGSPRPVRTPDRVLASRLSPPLSEAIRVTNKDSQNLHAEMLLREVGLQRRGVGSAEAGIKELGAFLKEAGLSPWEFFLDDASGLSRRDMVTPRGTVKLLRHMADSKPYRDSLAIGGVDGTLDWRFRKTAAEGRVTAKTGTLTHVTALAGYAVTPAGRELAFAVYVNNFGVSASYVRGIVDKIVLAILEEAERPAVETVSEQ